MDFLKSLHATAVNQIKSILNRYTRRIAMGPAELEIVFKRMFAFRIPKVPRIDFRG